MKTKDNPTQPHQPAIRAAEKIKDKYSVGTFSRFCDDPPDFDAAETSDVARIITTEYEPVVEAAISALKSARSAIGKCEPETRGALAIEKIDKALSLLTTKP